MPNPILAFNRPSRTFHPDTLLDNLAGLLAAKADFAGAEPLYRRARVIAEKTLGPDDDATREIRENLGALRKERARN